MKKFKIIATILILVLIIFEIIAYNPKKVSTTDKKMITVSSFVLYDITKYIAQDKFKIVNILPFGTDPHSFEPTPKLMRSIEKSSLVVLSGAGLEPWIDSMEFKAKVLDISKVVSLIELEEHENEDEDHEGHHHHHGSKDPHYWLDFENMKNAAQSVSSELTTLSPNEENFFQSNRDKYIEMLSNLQEKYMKKLSSCKQNHIILNHNAIGYLAHRYNFHLESLSGLSPEAESSPSDIKRIINDVKKEGIKTIFFEDFVNAKSIKNIANDTGINVEVFHTLGNITADQAKNSASYKSLMEENLKLLSKALECN